jgi:hypothetical protein
MRSLSYICSVLIAVCVSSCAQLTINDVRVHSLLGRPNSDDIRGVIAANPSGEKIYDIQVINRSEMHVFYHPISESSGYALVRRVNGKWCYIEKVAFTS